MGALTGMLNSPEGAEQIKGIAQALMNNQSSDETASDNTPSSALSSLSLPDISPNEISVMMKLLSALKRDEDDKTSALLYALKPHLSSEKQEKVDKAVKLIRLYKLIPLIKEGGFF